MSVTAPTAGDTISDSWTAGVSNAVNRTQAGVNAAATTSGTDTTTSSSYANMAGTGAVTSFSFTKREAGTRIKVTMHCSYSSVTNNAQIAIAARIDGTDYEVAIGATAASGQAKTVSGVAFVSSIAAGTYTVQGRWKRNSGTGTATRTTNNDWLTIVCEEVN
jgi:hypothetical protein